MPTNTLKMRGRIPVEASESGARPRSRSYPVVKLIPDGRANSGDAKWRQRLQEELALSVNFDGWSAADWETFLGSRKILSENYDTVVSLDWPHFCGGATEGCGGKAGWCYTLGGRLGGTPARSMRAAMTDRLAREHPQLFARVTAREVFELVDTGKLPYPNLRFSGSGEVHQAHIPALTKLADLGIALWGFSRNLDAARKLHASGIAVLFSCDSTTPAIRIREAQKAGLRLAYTSTDVDDRPPLNTFVTFPLHRSGHVKEVVESESLCPKVVDEYMHGKRRYGACELRCKRCHQKE